MKIVKKIFALSISAMLGLSFCAGTAFASKIFAGNSRIIVEKPIPVRPRPNNVASYLIGKNGKISINGPKYDTCLLTYNDYEEIEGLDIYSFIRGGKCYQ